MTSKHQDNGPDLLVNLELKAGDVVRYQNSDPDTVEDRDGELWVDGMTLETWTLSEWIVVSRASDAKVDTYDLSNPDKLTFEEMPDAMKGAMLLANYRGDVIQFTRSSGSWGDCNPTWCSWEAYRVKPKAPKAPDDIVFYGNNTFLTRNKGHHDTHKITIPADENRQPLPGTYTCDGREIIVEAV